jgi:quercetin dioxygenase-like cupin family protein
MKTLLTILLLNALTQMALSAQSPPGPVYQALLPTLPSDQEVRIDVVTMPPGFSAPVHRHDSYVYVYVMEGSVDMQVEGGAVQHLAAGQVFTETPVDIHTVMKNPSATETARFVAFTIKTAGAPPGTVITSDPK